MTDEIKEEKENVCFCKSKGFRKFLIVVAGSFVGAYLALCLFAAIHKPCPCGKMMRGYMPPPPIEQQIGHKKHHKGEFGGEKKIKKDFKGDRENPKGAPEDIDD